MSVAAPRAPQRLLVGAIQVFLAELLILPVGLLVAAYLTRRLGPEEFGVFALAVTLVSWLEWTVASVFARATYKLVGESDDWRPLGATLVRHQLGLSVVAMVALWGLSIPIARSLRTPALSPLLIVLAVDIPIFCLAQVHRNLLVGLGRFRERAYTSVARWTTRLVLVVLFIQLDLSTTGAALASVGASAVELAVARAFVRPSVFGRSGYPARMLYRYAAPLFLFALVMRLFDKMDLFALRALGGTLSEAGAYSAAQNLSLAPGLFALSFAPLLMATLSRRIAEGSLERAGAMAREAMRAALLLLPFASLVAGAASGIVRTCFGASFEPAAVPLAVLVLGATTAIMISVATAILTVAGKPGWTVWLTAPLLPAAVLGHMVMVPRFGTLGASLVTAGLSAAVAASAVVAVYRVWHIAPPRATAFRALIVAAAAWATAHELTTSGQPLVLQLTALTVATAAALLLLGEASTAERTALRARFRWPKPSAPATV